MMIEGNRQHYKPLVLKQLKGRSFPMEEVTRFTGLSQRTTQKLCNELVKDGLLNKYIIKKDSVGQPKSYYFMGGKL